MCLNILQDVSEGTTNKENIMVKAYKGTLVCDSEDYWEGLQASDVLDAMCMRGVLLVFDSPIQQLSDGRYAVDYRVSLYGRNKEWTEYLDGVIEDVREYDGVTITYTAEEV